ncbi:hypothetical protein [Serratia sp. DD3]|uniref:hypothetical protein n=1 Tax=Serratia sp. DD3 TaxID=1410619 RepID=UPI00040EAA2E|nr:hypothetical protein [Serratia sp. DD3]
MGEKKIISMRLLDEMERFAPGTVRVDKNTGAVTLIGWRLEQLDCTESDKQESSKDQRLAPVIKGSLYQRVIHFLSSFIGR